MLKKIVFILATISCSVYAEPSKPVAYLMMEPVTLFDQGMRDLGRAVDESLLPKEYPELLKPLNAWASYDWNTNAITIEGRIYQDVTTLESTTPPKLCERAVKTIKNNLGYGEYGFVKFGIAGLKHYFSHHSVTSKKEPEALENDLAAITKIRISVFTGTDNKAPFKEKTSCVSELTKDEILYSSK